MGDLAEKIKLGAKVGAAVIAVAATLIAGFEGLRTKTYRDPVGIPTVCYGETLGVKMGQLYTPAECKAMLVKRVAVFAAGMDKCLTAKVPDQTYVAFLSFAYNIGNGGFCHSSVARDANKGLLVTACNDLLGYTHAKGRTLPGLVSRRKQERTICLKGLSQ